MGHTHCKPHFFAMACALGARRRAAAATVARFSVGREALRLEGPWPQGPRPLFAAARRRFPRRHLATDALPLLALVILVVNFLTLIAFILLLELTPSPGNCGSSFATRHGVVIYGNLAFAVTNIVASLAFIYVGTRGASAGVCSQGLACQLHAGVGEPGTWEGTRSAMAPVLACALPSSPPPAFLTPPPLALEKEHP